MTENIEVFKQNSIRIKDGRHIIYIDPFEMDEEPRDASFIFITHEHYDHFSPDDIAKVANAKTIMIVPEKMVKKAEALSNLLDSVVTVKPGVYHDIDGLEFETVRAYNILKPFHPKGNEWVGYILHVDGQRIYIAGDTDATQEAKAVKCDIAMVPIGGTYTMDAHKAADLVNTIRPEIAIPVHYGSVVGSYSDAEVFEKNVKDPIKVVKKIKP